MVKGGCIGVFNVTSIMNQNGLLGAFSIKQHGLLHLLASVLIL